jgi:hypothetical protein
MRSDAAGTRVPGRMAAAPAVTARSSTSDSERLTGNKPDTFYSGHSSASKAQT